MHPRKIQQFVIYILHKLGFYVEHSHALLSTLEHTFITSRRGYSTDDDYLPRYAQMKEVLQFYHNM
jgi:hypothetical protein